MSKPVVKVLLVHGWFLEEGLRINLNPENGFPFVYLGDGFWMCHGSLWFRDEVNFEGVIYDHCGCANIKGTLADGKLTFEKAYTHRADVIHYTLTQDIEQQGFIFTGFYKGEAVGMGKTRFALTDPTRAFFE